MERALSHVGGILALGFEFFREFITLGRPGRQCLGPCLGLGRATANRAAYDIIPTYSTTLWGGILNMDQSPPTNKPRSSFQVAEVAFQPQKTR